MLNRKLNIGEQIQFKPNGKSHLVGTYGLRADVGTLSTRCGLAVVLPDELLAETVSELCKKCARNVIPPAVKLPCPPLVVLS